ncbi:hypothetical protein G7Y89_g11646 [Cudoniella acicularis]|uniref:MYND-type domain-containing protein n=1 Tax=Cudoniella acicularis TaxID=354080 RepID=A0A8H4VXU2_9HELO|nr:hypothetical protein G7Y89_g11646 [Cudoniella acicularis]
MATQQSLLIQVPCANTERFVEGKRSPCLNSAGNACSRCHLVQYCGRKCQIAHWGIHKLDCNSALRKSTWKPAWEVENREPTFIIDDGGGQPYFTTFGAVKYLWGNMPALDMLRATKNERDQLPDNLRLLFAGDIRNVVKTISELTTKFGGKCEVVVNDRDFDIVARNAILLLSALVFEPMMAAPIMIHIWYSALIPKKFYRLLQDHVLPLIEDVCAKIRAKPSEKLQSKTWTYGKRSLKLVLEKKQWDKLPFYLKVPAGLTAAKAQNIRRSVMLAPERKDYVDRTAYNRPPSWRVCFMKFREEGILAPFGMSREDFSTPNPTFYQTNNVWPMGDGSDPLSGWTLGDVLPRAPLGNTAHKDVYGRLFMFLQDVIMQFCHRIKDLNLRLTLLHLDARELPGILKGSGVGLGSNSFDRIEVSNITDGGFLGTYQTLKTFAPLLKRPTENRHATIIGLFLNAVHEVATPVDEFVNFGSETDRLSRYITVNSSLLSSNTNSAAVLQMIEARAIFRNYDPLFDRYMQELDFPGIAREVGLVLKGRNTVVEKWPLKLREGATQQEFDVLQASSHLGNERYVEWKVAA